MEPHEIFELLLLKKKIIDQNDVLISEYTLRNYPPIDLKLYLKSELNDDLLFLYRINQSSKNIFKLTLFLLERNQFIDIVRIDFSGKHKNPDTINDFVPDDLKILAGKWIGYEQPHIHINIKGYKPLSWARPIGKEFPIAEIKNQKDVVNAILEFNSLINLETIFMLDNPLLL
jgi:hypothetical protein